MLGILTYGSGSASSIGTANLVHNANGLVDAAAYNVSSALFCIVAMAVVGPAFSVRSLYENFKLLQHELMMKLQSSFSCWLSAPSLLRLT